MLHTKASKGVVDVAPVFDVISCATVEAMLISLGAVPHFLT
jgi:hypothetical protein